MRLISLSLSNFRQHADTSVTFGLGLTGIVGPNGEGKSTLLEGVAFALYGTRALRGTKGSLRWHRAAGRRVASAELTFELGGARYLVTRSENAAAIRSLEAGRLIAEGTAAVDAEIPRLLGMSHAEFVATYLCAQKDLGALLGMKGTERRQFFLRVTGVGRVDKAIRICRDRKSALRSEVAGLRQGLGERHLLAGERAAAEAHQERAIGAVDDALATAAGTEDDLDEAVEADAFQASSADRDAELRRIVAAARAGATSARQELGRAGTRLTEAREAGRRAADAEPRLEALPGLLERRETLRDVARRREERDQLAVRLTRNEQARATSAAGLAESEGVVAVYDNVAFEEAVTAELALQHRLSLLSEARAERRAEAKSERIAAESEAERNRKRLTAIRAAGSGGQCPTCLRELGASYCDVEATLVAEIARAEERATAAATAYGAASTASADEIALAAELAEVRVQLVERRAQREAALAARASGQRWRADVERLDREAADIRARIAELGADAAAAGEDPGALDSAIADLQELQRRMVEDRAAAAAIPTLEADVERWSRRIEDLNIEVVDAGKQLATLAFSPDARAAAASALVRARAAHQAAREGLARSQSDLDAATARVERATAALAEYDARAGRLDAAVEELRVLEAADSWFTEFRAALASAIRPEIEELASAMVAQLTDGRFEALTLDDDFQPTLHRAGIPMEVISGGEEDVVALSMRLATSQLIAERAGHPLSLLILDEPFGSQDQVRRANMLALLRKLSGVFQQVLVISHVDETREAVDRAIGVRYDEASGRSFVEETAPAAAPWVDQDVGGGLVLAEVGR